MAPSLPPKTNIARSSTIPYAKLVSAARRSARAAQKTSKTRARTSLSAPPSLDLTTEGEIAERVASPTLDAVASTASSSELELVESVVTQDEERIPTPEPRAEVVPPSAPETVESILSTAASAVPAPKRSSPRRSSPSSTRFFGFASYASFAAANKIYSASPESNLSATVAALAPSSSFARSISSSSAGSGSLSGSLRLASTPPNGFADFAASRASLSDLPPVDTPETSVTGSPAGLTDSSRAKGKKRAYEPEQNAAEGIPQASPRPTKTLRDRKSEAFAATSPAIPPSSFASTAYSRQAAEAELAAALSRRIEEQVVEISRLKQQLSKEQAEVKSLRKALVEEKALAERRDVEIERLTANIQEAKRFARKFLDGNAGAFAYDDSGFASESDSDDDDYVEDVVVEYANDSSDDSSYDSSDNSSDDSSDDESEDAGRFEELD